MHALCSPTGVRFALQWTCIILHHQGSGGALPNPSEVLTCLVRRLPALAPVSKVDRMLCSPTGS